MPQLIPSQKAIDLVGVTILHNPRHGAQIFKTCGNDAGQNS